MRTVKDAKRVLPVLLDCPSAALDAESIDVELKEQSPVGNGRVICFSVYAGDDVDFGDGPKLWVDTLDSPPEVFRAFKPWFSSKKHEKFGHNIGGFDRHAFDNHGMEFNGWGGDTMHKVRLLDAGRKKNSLEAITEWLIGERKVPMKERFGRPKLKKDGTPGKTIILPPNDELQRDPETFADWVDYSCFDTEGLWKVNEELDKRLAKMRWTGDMSMLDYYHRWWKPLGWIISNMERRGFTISTSYLAEIQPKVEEDRAEYEAKFKAWASEYCPDAVKMNVGSDKQLQVFLFGGYSNPEMDVSLPSKREFKVPNDGTYKSPKTGKVVKDMPITLESLELTPEEDEMTDTGYPAVSAGVLEKWAWADPEGKTEKEKGWGRIYHLAPGKEGRRACRAMGALAEVGRLDTMLSNFIIPLQRLVDKRGRVHTSINFNTESGRFSCKRPSAQNQPALEKDRYAIRDAWTVSTPNEWDGYDFGYAGDPYYTPYQDGEQFNLLVADYGQLELRLLAHMSNCKSMIDAFKAGGDFHSRTAFDMYSHIREAVEEGVCAIEENEEGLPLVKDIFGAERRRGKTLNFSVAYGKTKWGFARDWGVSVEEAAEVLRRWYDSRPEVRAWQKKTIERAYETGYTRTLMGRYRPLPGLFFADKRHRRHAERQAINTPIQGGAADVVNTAMVLFEAPIWGAEGLRHEELAHALYFDLGYRLLLQVHDELIFEGPARHAEEAKGIVKTIMSTPFDKPLRLDLTVDCSAEVTWFLAK